MKNILWPLALLCLSCHSPVDLHTEKMLQSLLDQKEYFKLKTSLALHEDRISPEKRLYFKAVLDNVFNRNTASNEHIHALLQQGASTLPDSIKANLIAVEADNYFKTFEYAKAAASDSELITHYRHAVDSGTYDNIKNAALIHNALAKIPSQQAMITANNTIPWTRDTLGLIEIPVKVHDSVYQGIFDTRADISCMTVSYARKLGIKILNVSYTVLSGATGNSIKSSLGIADSLRIGDILLRHVVFQVMPDEVLYIAPMQFSMNIIIGYPVIAQLKEIHIFRNGTMTIPLQPVSSDLNNLALDGLDPIVSCGTDGDTLCFQFDTGAGATDLYSNYFNKYKAHILKHGKAKTIRQGGAGGFVSRNIYVLDSLHLNIGSKPVTLKDVAVQIDPNPGSKMTYYGNLGQDLVSKFNEMILNFESMYIDFK